MECNLEELKRTVWLIRAKGKGNSGQAAWIPMTGVCIHKNGLIMTSTLYTELDNVIYEAKRGFKDEFDYTLVPVHEKKNYGVSFLKIIGKKDEVFDATNIVEDGTLKEGDQIFCIGHPEDYVYSLMSGQINFHCIEVDPPNGNNHNPCKDEVAHYLDITPNYRSLKHFWNYYYFKNCEPYELTQWEGNLEADLPVIQCSGICDVPSMIGSPVFNTSGKIVGMFIGSEERFQIAVHVTWLRPEARKGLDGLSSY